MFGERDGHKDARQHRWVEERGEVEQDRVDDHLKRNVRICEIESSQGIEWLFFK
jgi:hypothetical protein